MPALERGQEHPVDPADRQGEATDRIVGLESCRRLPSSLLIRASWSPHPSVLRRRQGRWGPRGRFLCEFDGAARPLKRVYHPKYSLPLSSADFRLLWFLTHPRQFSIVPSLDMVRSRSAPVRPRGRNQVRRCAQARGDSRDPSCPTVGRRLRLLPTFADLLRTAAAAAFCLASCSGELLSSAGPAGRRASPPASIREQNDAARWARERASFHWWPNRGSISAQRTGSTARGARRWRRLRVELTTRATTARRGRRASAAMLNAGDFDGARKGPGIAWDPAVCGEDPYCGPPRDATIKRSAAVGPGRMLVAGLQRPVESEDRRAIPMSTGSAGSRSLIHDSLLYVLLVGGSLWLLRRSPGPLPL